MRSRSRITAIVAALAAVLGFSMFAAGPAAAAEPEFTWLCQPGRADDPCRISLETGEVTATGQMTRSTPENLTRLQQQIDCFYVYPTVSGQAGPNADLSEDPEIGGIARQQAARFSPGCRMYAPVYRQYTVPALIGGGGVSGEGMEIAYQSFRAAWDEYLAQHNQGRGIVLIGHSQGTGHLKRLIAETFDQQPELRERLVSAVLIGGNVVVAKGQLAGGNFQNIPGCSTASQLGCVIAYSGFLKDPPPEDALFGRIGGALVESGFSPETHEVLCVNPAELDGSGGALKPLYNTEPFPGIYGPLLPDLTGIDAPWASFPGLYTGTCKKAGGASWLEVTDISSGPDARPRIGEPLGRAWGTHLTEVNDAAGNLLEIVTGQEAAYVEKLNQPRKKKLQGQVAKARKQMAKLRKQSRKLKQRARKAKGKKRRALNRKAKKANRKATAQQKKIKALRRQIEALDPLGA